MTTPNSGSIDILILTALREEYDQVLAIEAGAFPGTSWQIRPGPLGHEMAFRVFTSEKGSPLSVAVSWASTMGGVASAAEAERLIAEFKPRCLAMCGVCAGNRGDVQIGDVIIADRLWMYDTGKRKVQETDDGKIVRQEQGDIEMYRLRDDWRKAAQAFAVPKEIVQTWGKRPRPTDLQANWILEQIIQDKNLAKHPDRKKFAPNFTQALRILWKKGWVEQDTWKITKKGRQTITSQKKLHPDGLPKRRPFKIHVGPMASGNKVMQDKRIFEEIAESMRKVLGLEMEAAAIGAVAHAHRDKVPYMVVMKGVMDHADEWKNDTAKTFAARASAECLLAFLRKQVPPVPRFEDLLDAGTAEQPATPAPSHLVHAKYQFIRFYQEGRQAILSRLQAFCEGPKPSDVWLIHADGGMGKTRLLIEFTKHLRHRGWLAGFLSKNASPDEVKALLASDLPACVVIDYAEARPHLLQLLEDVAQSSSRAAPFRVVLLARHAGDWWTSLIQRESKAQALLLEHPPEALEPLVPMEQRIDLVRKTAHEFAAFRGKPLPAFELPSRELDDERFARTLYLHLAALAWVEGISFTANSLLDDVLAHEERFWWALVQYEKGLLSEDGFLDKARRVVAAMTLCGGFSSQQAGEFLLGRLFSNPDDRLLALVRRVYPGPRGCFTSPLEPDLLGDGMVWRTMQRLRDRGDSPAYFLERVFLGENDRALTAGFCVLGRLSVEHAEEVRPWIMHVLDGDLDKRAIPALEAAKLLGLKTAHAWVGKELAGALERAGTVDLARRLEEAGVPDGTVSLRELSEWVSRTKLAQSAAGDERIEVMTARAAALNAYGVQQIALAEHDAAITSFNEAIDIYRKLVRQYPDIFRVDLGTTLNNLAGTYDTLHQLDRALEAAQEAVAIHRFSALRAPEVLPHLALSLDTLANIQSKRGERDAALHLSREAAGIYRQLTDSQPNSSSKNDLARALNNLGERLVNLGEREAALALMHEVIAIRRELATDWPDKYLPDLATSLNNLCSLQAQIGQTDEAFRTIQESVEICRKLCDQQSDAFSEDLARSLSNLSNVQFDLDLHEAALRSASEAIDISRKHAEQTSSPRHPLFATHLYNLSHSLFTLNRHHEALPVAQEALDTIWPYYEKTPAAHGDLVRKLIGLLVPLYDRLDLPLDQALQERVKLYLALSGT